MEHQVKEIKVEMELGEVEPQEEAVEAVEKEVLEETDLDQALQAMAVQDKSIQYLELIYFMQQVVEVEPIYMEALEIVELVVLA
jgi:ADP-ribose pyrophosphatase YjhB (NUDIX family)